MIKYLFTLLTIVVGITVSSSIFAQDTPKIPQQAPNPVPQQFNITATTLPPGLQITVGRPMFCSNTETFLHNIANKYGEKSVFIGVVAESSDLLFDVLYNKDSKSFTMVQHFAVGNSCVLAAGKAVNVDFTADKAGHLINYKK
tara:strand:+ start:976 stop:1404 length:429 start_codon:yes stop_codon:yes gene_type:complete